MQAAKKGREEQLKVRALMLQMYPGVCITL